MTAFAAPRPIRPSDVTAGFSCGDPELDAWLRERALANDARGASRTFVSTAARTGELAGYYALAAGSVEPGDMPGRVPVVVLARLAVDANYQGIGVGSSLVRDAVRRAVAAGSQIGVRAVLIHARNDRAAALCERLGFQFAMGGRFTCVATLPDLRRTLGLD
ncbi:MAG: GNAT family N-acetyltransferase [Bifidobacteriaceae bacterium]|jgi:GNAT superfamily N-acetyltransferase|nr:GNAT family N-acetyltransferase [Bifidobacteriaceae bacterium]